jgi:kynurenine 3-monooxygenase
MSQPNAPQFTIVGAGLAGSLLALLLGRRGCTVHLYERRRDPRAHSMGGGRSINLALSARGIAALAAAGVLDDVMKMALPMHGRLLHDRAGGMSFIRYGRDGEAIFSVSRSGLNMVLLNLAASLPNVSVYFEHTVDHWDAGAQTVSFMTPAGLSTIPFSVLLATDGAFSATRAQALRQPRFSYEQTYIDHAYKELHLSPTASGEFAMQDGALHIWPRGDYMLIALPNPDRTFTCTLFLDHDGAEASFEALPTGADARRFFDREFADVSALLPDLEDQWHQNPTSHLHYVKCWPWNLDQNVLLLGDAAHAIVPFYGQGMNAAFEDCRLLDEALSAADVQGVRHSEVLARFAGQRKADADAICDLALYNFLEMRARVADPGFVERKRVESHFMEWFPETYRDLYGMVSFTSIPYSVAQSTAAAQKEVLDHQPEAVLALSTLGWVRQLAGAAPDSVGA